ncbi:MAG TPA: S9 family peptidase [Gemmatimonadales bacterium]|jgi:dipeptidyl aminopeptidase/acylaminoacyl peptidase
MHIIQRCRPAIFLLVAQCGTRLTAQEGGTRPVTVDDQFSLKDVSDPQISPDGKWVAYVVSQADLEKDLNQSDVWMTSWDGATTVQLTHTKKESESDPSWSPDGKYLAFLSDRDDENDASQLWLLNTAGGEAERLTDGKNGIESFAWAPDGKRMVFAIEDGDSVEVGGTDTTHKDTPKPIVVDRYYFKEDYTGYLGRKRTHLYLFDISTRVTTQLTSGDHNEALPSWSPDGKSIAFVSKGAEDWDRNDNYDVYVVDATPEAKPRQLTTFEGPDAEPDWESPPAWSPDGKQIAYLQGGPLKLIYYAGHKVAVIPAAGGTPRILSPNLDRNTDLLRWSPDGNSLLFLIEDDRTQYLASMPAAGGSIKKLLSGRSEVSGYSASSNGRIAVLWEDPSKPAEVYALEDGKTRQLSHQNDSLLATLKMGKTEEISVKSKDGTTINGFMVLPPDYAPGKKYPTILRLHGGPVSQFPLDFNFMFQCFAANGYVVVATNPRGSSGRGEKFSLVIYADWGNKDVQDVLAGVDYTVAKGISDPDHLGVGGWSYGGILTNYVIASDTRFKAAISGAGASDVFAGYGTDMYVREYDNELGPPWKSTETYLKLSYPFLHADRIKTPTLFMAGQKDFNVPLLNSEQMYQALRTLGVPTQLVIYPGQYHGISKPSYVKDRLERYVAWYDKYLK